MLFQYWARAFRVFDLLSLVGVLRREGEGDVVVLSGRVEEGGSGPLGGVLGGRLLYGLQGLVGDGGERGSPSFLEVELMRHVDHALLLRGRLWLGWGRGSGRPAPARNR